MSKGLYRKYQVTRLDGRDSKGRKHNHCMYFVMDLNHDPAAYIALAAYADTVAQNAPALSGDLKAVVAAYWKSRLCAEGASMFAALLEGYEG